MGAVFADDMPITMQRMTIAHLFRVFVATSYWRNMIEKTDIKNVKKLFKGSAKIWYKRTEDWINQWLNEIKVHGAGNGHYEALLDCDIDYTHENGQFIFYHEQALKRMLDRMKVPYSDILSKIATARDLIDCAAIVNGMEMAMYPTMRILNQFCGGGVDPVDFVDYQNNQPYPNLMARLLKFHNNFTIELYKNIGRTDVKFDMNDEEVERSISITAMKMQDAFTNYDWIVEHADTHIKEWIEENSEEFAKQVNEIKRGKAKEYARRERVKAKKEAGFSVQTNKGQLQLHGVPHKSDVQVFDVRKCEMLPNTPQLELVYSMEIEKLTTFFNWRVRKNLPAAGIKTIGDLLTNGKEKIVRIPGVGEKSWENIIKGVKKLGIGIKE